MSPDPDAHGESRPKLDLERQRVPLERKISLKFKEFRGFITEYSDNLSLGGMFIRTTSPKPAGTIFDFELSLTDDFKLVQGIGEVVWIREQDAGPERPAGMGVRFLDLSPESRKLIERIVDEHVQHGGTPFELEKPQFPPPLRPATPAEAPRPAPAAPTGAPSMFHATAAPMSAPPPPRRAAAGSPGPAPTAETRPAAAPPPPLAPAPAQRPLWAAPDSAPPAAASSPAGAVPAAAGALPGAGGGETEPPGELFPDLGDLSALPDLEIGDLAAAEAGRDAEPTPAPWDDLPEADAEPLPTEDEAPPPSRPPLAAAPGPLPAGFDEVARVFASPAAGENPLPAAPRFEVQSPTAEPAARTARLPLPPDLDRLVHDETVRLERTPSGPRLTDSAGSAAASWAPATHEPSPAAGPAPPPAGALAYPRPARRPAEPPRRRPGLGIAVAAALLLLAGGAAAVWFAFPELVPAWVPGSPAVTVAASQPLTAPAPAGPAEPAAEPAGAPPAEGGGAQPAAAPPDAAPTTKLSSPPAAEPQPPASAFPVLPPAQQPGEDPAARRGTPSPRKFTAIEEIWGQRTAAGTLVTLVADGRVPEGAYTTFRLEGGNPREVLRLKGVAAGFGRPTVAVATAEVRQVRVGYHEKPEGNELHVVMDLASARVRLLRVVVNDNRIEMLLAPE